MFRDVGTLTDILRQVAEKGILAAGMTPVIISGGVDGAVDGDSYMVFIGADLAAKAKGRDKAIKFVGIDALPGLHGGRQVVADGKLEATFVYPTGGREAVDAAVKILRGEKVPHKIVLATEKITRK